jgi:hypothetical protein
MQKGENIISIALAAAVVLAVLAVQRRWNPADLKDVATSAEDFLLTTTGMRGEVPNIPGYEKLKTYRLERYRAALYRSSPAPLVFAPGRFVIYNRDNQPVFKLETLEGSKDSWTALYDFAGRHGLPVPGSRARPEYTRNLTGNDVLDVIVGQYSGGDHCCTLATVLELGSAAVTVLGRIDGLDGMPFEGLEVRKLDKDASYEFVAHRPYMTACGPHTDAADVVAIFDYVNGRYTDQTARFADYLGNVLHQDLSKWKQEKARTLELLQTIAASYAVLGEKDQGKRFFAMNLNPFLPNLKQRGVDPNACIEALENLLDRLPSVSQLGSAMTTDH